MSPPSMINKYINIILVEDLLGKGLTRPGACGPFEGCPFKCFRPAWPGAVLLLCGSCCHCRPRGARMPSTFQRHPTPGVVTVGVDTHADVHVAAVVDGLGRLLGSLAIPTTVEGYAELLAWAEGFGQVGCFGVEGTGSWGAGLSRWLTTNGQAVVEVPRADRA